MDAGVFEFRDQQLERSAGLTADDRKWMDTIVTDANESWDEKLSTRLYFQKRNSGVLVTGGNWSVITTNSTEVVS